ncbi:hypothetical protein V8D89_010322 [Ganoderma adspersum]
MDPPLDPELELRAHIRSLLLEYALTHLATNYVTWTQNAVTDLLSESLVFAPTRAPTEVTLPVDPFQILSQSWGLSKLNLYEERWKVDDAEALSSYIKRQISVPPGVEMSEKLWNSDSDEDFHTFLLSRPLSPILSCRSRRETPLSSKSMATAQLPQSHGELLETWRIYPAENITFDETNVNVDDALGNKLEFDAESHLAVLNLIKTVPAMSARTETISETRNFDEFLRVDTPPLETLEPEMLPLFPRSRQPGLALASPEFERIPFITSLEAMTKLPGLSLSSVEVNDEDEEDIANEHLKQVGGWDGIRTPSSPLTLGTPSLVDTSSDIDELFLPSSAAEGLGEEFLPMEEFQLPKAERLGGRCSKLLGEGKKQVLSISQCIDADRNCSLSSFISPLLRLSQAPGSLTSPKSPISSPPSQISLSMLGQPSSEASHNEIQIRSTGRGDVSMSSDDSFTFAAKTIERACGGFLGDGDPYSLILGEKIDEKDEYLMNVPTLAPPNEHDASTCLPTRLSELVVPATSIVPPGSGPPAHRGPYTGFLKKAKGLQSLQLELSWIPFKYGRTVPTDEEVADVADDISAQLVKAIELPQDDVTFRLSELLNYDSAFSSSSQPFSTAVPSALVWSLDDELDSPILASELFDDGIGLVLTRRDRMRLAGISTLEDWDHDEDTGGNGGEDTKDNATPRGRPTKRVRFQDHNDLEKATRTIFEEVIDEAAYTIDDSGVVFASPEPHIGAESYSSSFTQMAYDAEGFDGPAADGNLFLDMDIIHCGRDDSDLPSDYLSDPPGTSAFPIPPHSHNHAFAPASPERSQITHINEPTAADELSPGHPHRSFRSSPSAPLGCGPLASTGVVPAAISSISPDPYPASEAMVNEDGLQAVPTSFATTSTPAISARQSLAQYLALCGKASVVRPDISTPPCTVLTPETGESAITVHQVQAAPSSGTRDTPAELFDDRTLVLPDRYTRPDTGHTYMASLSLVQKRALVRALGSYCAVDLVEREALGGSSASPETTSGSEDLILDCDTAVLFPSLELLPARSAGLLALLARLSWHYAHLLVVFECYPSAWDCSGGAPRTGADRRVASVWSPPVVKAVRNLKRDLAISEGLQTKREACLVEYAFANSPEEAAAFARTYGDFAEARDATGGDVWGQRLWLTYEERDGECDLCGVDSMNPFASCLLLSQVSLENFLEKTPEERLLEYRTLIGSDRIGRFNAYMARRLDAMQLPPSSPIDTSSSLHSVPVLEDCETDGLH